MSISRTAVTSAALAAGAACLVGIARSATPAPPVPSALDRLGAFLGEWHTSGESRTTPYSRAGKSSGDLICTWAPNHGFLLCDNLVHRTAGTGNELSIYSYNDKTQAYQFVGLTRNDAAVRTTKLTIEGKLWTYSSDATIGGKVVHFRTVNVLLSPTYRTYRSEYSEDGSHWILMSQGSATRVK